MCVVECIQLLKWNIANKVDLTIFDLPFVKMQAQGNDFVILDALAGKIPELTQAFIKTICNRRLGIGCDQLLVLQPHDNADVLMLIFNADGSQAANCGNGLRCVGDMLIKKLGKAEVSIALADRIVGAKKTKRGVRVNMGEAQLERATSSYIDVDIGNPHRVYFDGAASCPERNVEKVTSYDQFQATINITERGSGETLACGSGACAVAMALWYKLGVNSALTIHMPGGDVFVSQSDEDIYLEGEVILSFKGLYSLAEL